MKQSIVVRTDLGMGDGKIAAQVAHASLQAYENATEDARSDWKSTGMKKVVLEADSEDELLELRREAESVDLPTSLIKDAGHTQIEPGTLTALGVGPADDDEIDRVTGDLRLL